MLFSQELITRTERLGQIRKQLFSFELEHELSDQILQSLSDNKVKIVSRIKFNDKFSYLLLTKITEDELKIISVYCNILTLYLVSIVNIKTIT